MESPRKFNDCYFYYYSTCTKGENCVFRHEPSALGCETMCAAWQQGKCMDKKCRLRHMELRKNRKQIPCYWESQPTGCRKKHCPFMHKNPEARTDGILPSQPGMAMPPPAMVEGVEAMPPVVPGVAPVPLLWQQQRQVVLDSAILGVLPASSELMGARRVLPPHEAAANPYAPLPVDPLVVNFDDESDNESAPSCTPTKPGGGNSGAPRDGGAPSTAPSAASQELMLLQQIQAEAAAYYSYDAEPPKEVKERKIVRTNLSTKYDRVSLDELTGKKNPEKTSLDFKVMSLDEIRAKKRSSNESLIPTKPITLNLNRKRKISTQETIIDSGNKIIKVVRSNSIVYKKVDENAQNAPSKSKVDAKSDDGESARKRTCSEQSDVLEVVDIELDDDCFKFKRIKLMENTSKPKLIRHTSLSSDNKVDSDLKDDLLDIYGKADDSDTEVQIVGEEITLGNPRLVDTEVIDLDDSAKMAEPIDIVDLSDDEPEINDIDINDIDLELIKNVPDVVASCHTKNVPTVNTSKEVIENIDDILDESL
ncbi:hypothetical protein JYU34_010286 [Plutella xylostella]|uniref:C3H1-type domain-containing protein n=1 Tax=Plutella xylostella TaxID=51655 RepID=A0ABQ7QI58_PLUXY|nr:hypothetical protein JYU34_010286 [Plutella xylostella]